MRTILTIVVLVLIAIASSILSPISFWLALVSFLALTIMFVYNAIQMVPASPPHKAILVFLGERQKVVLGEGWNYVPLYPVIFSFILIKVEKVNYDLEPQRVRTPDRAEVSLKTSITWIPGIKDSPEAYITYLNSGGEEGVKRIIHDVIEDRTKSWAGSSKEGPSTWIEAQALKDDAHEVLVKSILGDTLDPVDSLIPTNTWMRFFDDPQSEPTEYDANPHNKWAFKGKDAVGNVVWNWDDLQAIFDSYSQPKQDKLRDEVDQRKKDVRKIREGKGDFGDKSLGITIVRFTVNEVKVEGEVAKAAELEEKERRERDADTMEIENVSARIQKLRQDHPEMSLGEAARIIQTERGKISKSVIEVLGASTGLGQDFLGALGFQRMSGGKSVSDSSKKKGKRARKEVEDDDDDDEEELERLLDETDKETKEGKWS